jgi:hypothetical protein
MEIVTFRKKLKIGQSLNIYSLGDIHEGNCNSNHEALKKAVGIIRDDPDGYWVGMGDYIDAITHDDKKRFNPVTVSEKYKLSDLKDLPVKQMEFVFDVINSIQGKCIVLLCGNHEESYTKNNSNDIYERFTNMFASSAWGAEPPKRLGYIGFLVYRIEGANSVIHLLNHGNGVGGLTEGYGITKAWQMASSFDCDISWIAHIHQLVEDDKKIIGVTEKGRINRMRKFVGVTGSFLNTYDEGHANYFEGKGRKEGDIGMLKASITLLRTQGLSIKQEKIKLD